MDLLCHFNYDLLYLYRHRNYKSPWYVFWISSSASSCITTVNILNRRGSFSPVTPRLLCRAPDKDCMGYSCSSSFLRHVGHRTVVHQGITSTWFNVHQSSFYSKWTMVQLLRKLKPRCSSLNLSSKMVYCEWLPMYEIIRTKTFTGTLSCVINISIWLLSDLHLAYWQFGGSHDICLDICTRNTCHLCPVISLSRSYR